MVSYIIKNICTPLNGNLRYRNRDTSHLIDIIDTINKKRIPDKIIFVLFDIVNMFPSIDNVKRVKAVRFVLNARNSKNDQLKVC